MSSTKEQILAGSTTAFWDASCNSNLAYRPQFISNNHTAGQKVLATIENELRVCDSFVISVAFITLGGIEPLLQVLQELGNRNIPGKILTTDYNMFTDPRALDKLAGLKNIELRMYHEVTVSNTSEKADTEKTGFHTKGYIFKKADLFTVVVGSSNMTMSALTVNKEWNTKLVSAENGEILQNIRREFEQLWTDQKHTGEYSDFIEEYRTKYNAIRKQRQVARQAEKNIISFEQYKLQPNKMQVKFINRLKEILQEEKDKALLISATGTGKTYASAFGVRDAIKPQGKVLFVVHRKQILKQAISSYQQVFGQQKKMVLLTGDDKDFEAIQNADFVFAMITMLSKDEILQMFAPNEFSVAVFDEVHHATANMYQKVLHYFQTDFLLGMTATPDRTDSGNIYEIFDNNIAYEIRLQQALEYNLLCPFHYFGITDITLNGEYLNDDIIDRAGKGDFTIFNMLTSDERVDYVLKQAKYYGYSGNRVKGLIFCSSIRESIALSEKFNQRGLKTIALTGSFNDDEREEAIDRLVSDAREDYLDYILTVNIFNEGVDIPEVNQVIMLRPTESAIVFIQQLGRGLRKYSDKEFVVILDFIGNYNNNFLIPIALSGDRTYNKDNMRKYMMEGASIIPGSSSIHFDEIAKKNIFDAIDRATTPLKFLKEMYFNLKYKLGHVPSITEFYQYGDIDPILFIEYKKAAYHKFVQAVDKDSASHKYTDEQEKLLDFVALNLANGKRPHELVMLKQLMESNEIDQHSFEMLLSDFQRAYRQEDFESAKSVLEMNFINTQSEKEKYQGITFIKDVPADLTERSHIYYSGIKGVKEQEFVEELRQLVDYGLMRYRDYFMLDSDEDNLVLYQKYSRKDICRILNWAKDDSMTMYGYRIKYGTCPIFVTYEKKDDISESTKYKDQFIDNTCFSWMTRNRVSEESTEAQQLIHAEENGLKVFLFVKKSDGEGTDFYYCGRVRPIDWRETTIENDKGSKLPIMNFKLQLDHPVRNDIYEYLTK